MSIVQLLNGLKAQLIVSQESSFLKGYVHNLDCAWLLLFTFYLLNTDFPIVYYWIQ